MGKFDKNFVIQQSANVFRYTEIWSLDGISKNIKLAEPILGVYNAQPELFLVDTSFCVKP